MKVMSGRAALVLLALGATLGSALDGIHTHTGTTFYPYPLIWKMAWWTPLLFAFAGLSIGLSRPLLDRLLSRRFTPRHVLAGMLLFMLAYALSGLLPGGLLSRTLVLGVIFLCSYLLCDRSAVGLLHALATAAAGVAVEATLVRHGYFFYTQGGHLAGTPLWLPLLYGAAAVGVGGLGQRLIQR